MNIQPLAGFASLSLDSHFEAALRLHRAGNLQEAAHAYQQLLNRSARHIGALRNLGLLHSVGGNYAEAVKLLRRAVRCDPATGATHRDLARALTAAGDLRAAVTTYDKALELIPDDPTMHCELGAALHSLGRRNEAVGHYRKAIALKPDFAAAYNDLGVVLQEMSGLE